MFQGLSPKYQNDTYSVLFPGSEMPEWFSHQCIGDGVNIMEPFSHLRNDWIGIAVCVVFCSLQRRQIQSNSPIRCKLTVDGNGFDYIPGETVFLSDHIHLCYILPQFFMDEEHRKSLWECDANGFCKIGIKIIEECSGLVKKCGLRLVYKKDIEDLNNAMALCSNNSIIPYEGFDIPHHNFNNSAVVVEVNKNDCEESS